MNTTTTATAAAEELNGLVTEFDLDLQDCYKLSDAEMDFALDCYASNTIDELATALRAGVEHWTCAPTCAELGLHRAQWQAGIRGALTFKVFRKLEDVK